MSIRHRGRGPGHLSRNTFPNSFTPLSLFASGEQGAWYDPSDLSTLYQDTAGAVPVTAAGQSVARINDKSGNGNNLLQTTALARPVLRSGKVLGLNAPFDYYIDAVSGSDSNDGLTPGTAWATLSKADASLIATGETKRVLVKAGTYDTATDSFRLDLTTQTDTMFFLVFEPGCIIDGTSFTLGTQNGITFRSDIAGDRTNKFYAYGNGCIIRNVTTADGNGLDGSGGGASYFYDFEITNCRDGISIHETQYAEFHRVSASDCLKWALAHVGDCETKHYDCTFADENNTATLGGLASPRGSGGTYFENCTFLPGTTGESREISCQYGDVLFSKCQLGTLTRYVEIAAFNSGTATVEDSYINANYEGVYGETAYTRAFGKFSARTGAGGVGLTMDNCTITAPRTGASAVLYSNYNPGSSAPFLVSNCVFETANFMDVDITNAGYLAAAGSSFLNNVTFGSTYDADLVSAGAIISGTVTSDPLIGAGNTLAMADYAYASGSPCIGAGTYGGNIGFSAAEVVDIGPGADTVPRQYYLEFDGNKDMATAAIDFTGTDAMTVFAAIRANASLGMIAELSADGSANAGAFYLYNNELSGRYDALSRGSASGGNSSANRVAPDTAILTAQFDISSDTNTIRRNQIAGTPSTSDQGSGNFGSHALYVGSRAGSAIRFTGNLYGLIVRGEATDALTVAATEDWMNSKTGAY